jgi:hypothetical protein
MSNRAIEVVHVWEVDYYITGISAYRQEQVVLLAYDSDPIDDTDVYQDINQIRVSVNIT